MLTSLGHPVHLIRLLNESKEIRVQLAERPQCIAADSIVPWHELGTTPVMKWPRRPRGFLMGWKNSSDNNYRSFDVTRPEYAEIGQHESIEDWECDISHVHGFSCSKSELHDFATTDAMVERNSREMIEPVTMRKLEENLAHHEIRIIHNPGTSDCFARYQWDGRLFLMNAGGSHHFAAAKYIAARLQEPVPLKGTLMVHSINAGAVASLRADYEMFVIGDTPDVSNAFHEAMAAFKATWLWHHMPEPYDNTKAILLPRSEARSNYVAKTLREAGIADLGAHLTQLVQRQERIQAEADEREFEPIGCRP